MNNKALFFLGLNGITMILNIITLCISHSNWAICIASVDLLFVGLLAKVMTSFIFKET